MKQKSRDFTMEMDMKYDQLSLEELCQQFNTHPIQGLSNLQAKENQRNYGPNILKSASSPSECLIFFGTMFGGFSLVLWFKIVIYIVAYVLTVAGSGTGDVLNDYLVMMVAITVITILIGLLSYLQESKARRITEEVKSGTHSVIRDGSQITVKVEELTLGDLLPN